MSKQLLYIEDLYDFYSNYKDSVHFDADKSGNPIVVQVKGQMRFDSDDKSKEGLLPVHLQACHTNVNRKGSNISDSVAEAALASLSNRPILAYIHKVNNKYEFYKHNMHEDKDGDIVYDEIPVGIIPESCGAKLVYDNEKNKKYVEADGYIFEEYSKAAQILRREKECAVSVEIHINELSYNAKEKYLDIEDFYFVGVTILGKNENGRSIKSGMEGANIKLSDFSQKSNSMFSEFSEELNEIKTKLNEIQNIHFSCNRKEENTEMNNKNIKFSVEFNGKTKNFELSLQDKINALCELVNSAYGESDNTFYGVICYDNYVVMYDYQWEKYYKQSYSVNGDKYVLTGERVRVYAEFVTLEEQSVLDEMRKNYSSLVEYKEKNEFEKAHSEKEKILKASKYSILNDNEKYKKLFEDMDKYSVSDLEKEVKIIFADYVSEVGQFSMSEKPANKVSAKTLRNPSNNHRKSRRRYGNIFSD